MSPVGSDDLYNEAILSAARAEPEPSLDGPPDLSLRRDNRFCGDRVSLDIALDQDSGAITAIAPTVKGCLLVQASAQMLAEAAKGQDWDSVLAATKQLRALLKEDGDAPDSPFGALEAFRPVAAHKSRHECCLLPFEAIEAHCKAAQSAKKA
ncbi:MAG: iron-sulfur cluster assembly scaffold protein [Rhodospirillaceae bacterium]